MNEMIERMTIAAYNKFNESLVGCCESTWEQCPEDSKERFRDSMIAAVKVMREPTHEMKHYKDEFGDEFCRWDWNCYMCGGPKDNWYAMIDSVLK